MIFPRNFRTPGERDLRRILLFSEQGGNGSVVLRGDIAEEEGLLKRRSRNLLLRRHRVRSGGVIGIEPCQEPDRTLLFPGGEGSLAVDTSSGDAEMPPVQMERTATIGACQA